MKKHRLAIFFLIAVGLHGICDITWWSIGRYTDIHWYFVLLGIIIIAILLTASVERLVHGQLNDKRE
jgi:RsiW-degrading membrane proteinase PrsW (M82 family)